MNPVSGGGVRSDRGYDPRGTSGVCSPIGGRLTMGAYMHNMHICG
jgi:hypothetical protein